MTERSVVRLPTTQTNELLERVSHLDVLVGALEVVVSRSSGRLLFVSGEAGVGKTALLREFSADPRIARLLWGACDPLFAPRPLGPFLELATVTGGELFERVDAGARAHEITTALAGEFLEAIPTLVVLEDMHWADEASLDVLRLLGRRIEGIPALVIATYRDDELTRAHPLRIVLGHLATARGIERLKVEPLSAEAVAQLAEPVGADAEALFRRTAGNPFFVTEVLAAGEAEIPPTVRDAVLARAARLTPLAKSLLEVVAAIPPQAELWLLKEITPEAVGSLDECLSSGMLVTRPGTVAFTHEIARAAVEESLPPDRLVELHGKALAALAAPPDGAPDLARLAHHAEAAGDARAVSEFAPAAARHAGSLGAHREAAAQYARALRFSTHLSLPAKAELLERRSHHAYLTDQYDEAIEMLERALAYYRELGDRTNEARALRELSSILWCPGRVEEAHAAAERAVRMLEELRSEQDLAMAHATLANRRKDAERMDEALDSGAQALVAARRLDDVATLVYAETSIATARFMLQGPDASEPLERNLELAEQSGLEEHVAGIYVNLAWVATRHHAHTLAARYVEEGLRYCSERGLELFLLYLLSYQARLRLDQGHWDAAVQSAEMVLRIPRTSTIPRINGLVVLGLVRARRGEESWAELDEALALAEPSGELQRIAPVAAARAEAFFLEGRSGSVPEATQDAFELALERRASWPAGELACWRRRSGVEQKVELDLPEPYALELAGEAGRAAAAWEELGSPYDAALARAGSVDEASLRETLAELDALGGKAAAAVVARRLRNRGVRGVRRGPRPSTRGNPAGLTAREVEVLALVAQGLGNAQIAERLFLSQKTIEHHVSAILRKLDVPTRTQAGAEAARLGIAG